MTPPRMRKQPLPMTRVIQKTLQLHGAHPYLMQHPSEDEIASAADKLAILISNVQPNGNPFCIPENLGALPPLWLQARLTLSLTAIQEKFARILLSVACELWLRGKLPRWRMSSCGRQGLSQFVWQRSSPRR